MNLMNYYSNKNRWIFPSNNNSNKNNRNNNKASSNSRRNKKIKFKKIVRCSRKNITGLNLSNIHFSITKVLTNRKIVTIILLIVI